MSYWGCFTDVHEQGLSNHDGFNVITVRTIAYEHVVHLTLVSRS